MGNPFFALITLMLLGFAGCIDTEERDVPPPPAPMPGAAVPDPESSLVIEPAPLPQAPQPSFPPIRPGETAPPVPNVSSSFRAPPEPPPDPPPIPV